MATLRAAAALSGLSGELGKPALQEFTDVARTGIVISAFALPPIILALAAIIFQHASLEYLFTLVDVLLGIMMLWAVLYRLAGKPGRSENKYMVTAIEPMAKNQDTSQQTGPMSPLPATPEPLYARADAQPEYLQFLRSKTLRGDQLSSFQVASELLPRSGGQEAWAAPRVSDGTDFDELITVLRTDTAETRPQYMPDELLLRTPPVKPPRPDIERLGNSAAPRQGSPQQPAERVRRIFAEDEAEGRADGAAGGVPGVRTISLALPPVDGDVSTDEPAAMLGQPDDDAGDEAAEAGLEDRRGAVLRRVQMADTHL